MSTHGQTGRVQTVLGPIEPGELGTTLTHEHLLIDLSFLRPEPAEAHARRIFHAPLTLETLGYVKHYSMASLDDSRLLDVDTAIEEARLYRQYGGDSLVDATSIGIARDPVSLARISRETGLNIVMGSAYYVDGSHPPDMDERTEDEITDQIVRDITEGVDGTGIRSGVIGEVGCSWPLTDNERKVVRASGRAQRITGAPLLVHPGRNELSPRQIMDLLEQAGADLGRTTIGHLDRTVFRRETLREIAGRGCFLEWDLFGLEQSLYVYNRSVDMPNDAARMDAIEWAISEGYGDRIVIAQDICHKNQLLKYGGHGYAYILAHIVPRMRARGFAEAAIHGILVDNPAAILTFAEARA